MVKSDETLVDSDIKVDVNTGIMAAGRLRSAPDSRDYDHELLLMKGPDGRNCAVVKSGGSTSDVGRDHREAG